VGDRGRNDAADCRCGLGHPRRPGGGSGPNHIRSPRDGELDGPRPGPLRFHHSYHIGAGPRCADRPLRCGRRPVTPTTGRGEYRRGQRHLRHRSPSCCCGGRRRLGHLHRTVTGETGQSALEGSDGERHSVTGAAHRVFELVAPQEQSSSLNGNKYWMLDGQTLSALRNADR